VALLKMIPNWLGENELTLNIITKIVNSGEEKKMAMSKEGTLESITKGLETTIKLSFEDQ
jgi:hypothetical protein